jgi:aldehyde:ferredoxin oxidoreductase
MAELEYGWAGKLLKVDLTTGIISIIPTSDYATKYIGGRLL